MPPVLFFAFSCRPCARWRPPACYACARLRCHGLTRTKFARLCVCVHAPPPLSPVSTWSASKLTSTLRCFNLLNGIGLILSGSLCLVTGFVSLGFSSITVSIYIAYVRAPPLHMHTLVTQIP